MRPTREGKLFNQELPKKRKRGKRKKKEKGRGALGNSWLKSSPFSGSRGGRERKKKREKRERAKHAVEPSAFFNSFVALPAEGGGREKKKKRREGGLRSLALDAPFAMSQGRGRERKKGERRGGQDLKKIAIAITKLHSILSIFPSSIEGREGREGDGEGRRNVSSGIILMPRLLLRTRFREKRGRGEEKEKGKGGGRQEVRSNCHLICSSHFRWEGEGREKKREKERSDVDGKISNSVLLSIPFKGRGEKERRGKESARAIRASLSSPRAPRGGKKKKKKEKKKEKKGGKGEEKSRPLANLLWSFLPIERGKGERKGGSCDTFPVPFLPKSIAHSLLKERRGKKKEKRERKGKEGKEGCDCRQLIHRHASNPHPDH